MGPGLDESSMGGSTTGVGDGDGDTGLVPLGDESTGVEPGEASRDGDGESGGSTGASFDDSTGDDDAGESSGSTGEVLDSTTGHDVVLSVHDLVPGDLVVTEVMWNPHCLGDDCEWIEILNTTESTVNLLDLYVQDGDYNAGNQGRVTLDLLVESGQVVVLARSTGMWPYLFTADAVYGPNPGLNNGSPDRVVLRNAAEILDETSSFSLEGEEGVAWSLSATHFDAASNDDSAHWCDATTELEAGFYTEYGTPGVLNPAC